MKDEIMTNATQNFTAIYSSEQAASLVKTNSERTIVTRWKNPVRIAAINISNAPWSEMSQEVPEKYSQLLAAILEDNAKATLKAYCESFTAIPTTIDATKFESAALIEFATSRASEWIAKEQLQILWNQSATRKRLVESPRYAQEKAYRVAVNAYSELVLKFSGRTSRFEDRELDQVLAKMSEEDLTTELGSFIIRRVETLKNKPQPTAVDYDIL